MFKQMKNSILLSAGREKRREQELSTRESKRYNLTNRPSFSKCSQIHFSTKIFIRNQEEHVKGDMFFLAEFIGFSTEVAAGLGTHAHKNTDADRNILYCLICLDCVFSLSVLYLLSSSCVVFGICFSSTMGCHSSSRSLYLLLSSRSQKQRRDGRTGEEGQDGVQE